MFGYVRPSLSRLSEEDKRRFHAVYCGLCRALEARCGTAARFILNYDFAFLAVLLSPPQAPEPLHRACMAHPVAGRDYFPLSDALALAADCSVILAWWQIQDAIRDHGAAESVKYRAAAAALGGAYRRAGQARPDFDRATRDHLERLARLEEERCPSIDRAAEEFAALLGAIGRQVEDPVLSRVLEQMLYHLGRWVYLIDAADDLQKDAVSGNYNPVALRYGLRDGKWNEESRRAFARTLDHSIHMIATAFELWDFGVWRPLLESTVYTGLFAVGRAVLEGTFHKMPPREQRKKHKKAEETT